MSVKKKMIAGGIAITKLNAMDDALSVIPTDFIWLKKNLITSKSGMPRNPGNEFALLFLTKNVAGPVDANFCFILVINDILNQHSAY